MCSYTGLESRVWHVFGPQVKVYKCIDTNRHRLVAHDSDGVPVSALLVNPHNRVRTYQVDAVYTLPEARRQGYAKQLLAVARHTLGTVNHSQNMTKNGLAWRNSVEGLK